MANNQPVTQDQFQQLTSRYNKLEKWTYWKIQGNDPSTNYGLPSPVLPSGINPNPHWILWVLENISFGPGNMISPETNFYGSVIINSNFTGIPSSVTDIDLSNTYTANSNFSGVTLSVELAAIRATLLNSNFSDLTTPTANFDGAFGENCNFDDFTTQTFFARGAFFVNCEFNPLTINVGGNGGDFTGASFCECNFSNSLLTGSLFIDTNLTQSNFSDAICEECDFSNSCLKQANFNGVDFTDCNFTNCNFEQANLFGAVVTNAIFTGATNMGSTNITSATGLDSAIFSGPVQPLQANVQTGSYAVVFPLDIGQPLIFDITGAATCTLPAAFSGGCSLWYDITNQGTSGANLTIDPNGNAINGVVASIILTPGQTVRLTWSSTAGSYYTNR